MFTISSLASLLAGFLFHASTPVDSAPTCEVAAEPSVESPSDLDGEQQEPLFSSEELSQMSDVSCHTEYDPCKRFPKCALDVPQDPYGQVARQVCCEGDSCWTNSSVIICGCF